MRYVHSTIVVLGSIYNTCRYFAKEGCVSGVDEEKDAGDGNRGAEAGSWQPKEKERNDEPKERNTERGC